MRINARRFCQNAIIWVLIICLLQGALVDYIGEQLEIISFFPDLLLFIGMLFSASCSKKSKFKVDRMTSPFIVLILFVLYECISLLYGGSIFTGLKIIRYALSASMIFYLGRKYSDEGFIERIFRVLTIVQIVNLILTIHQYFVMGLHPDFCNGIFGFVEYNNGQQGFFCLLICIVSLAKYVMKKISVKRLAFYFGMSSIICAISEIKAFFVMLLLVCLAGFVFEIKSWKKLKKLFKVMVVGAGALALGYFLLSIYMPDNLYTFFNIEAYLKYEAYAQNRTGVGRLNQVSYIYSYEFSNNFFYALMGKGVGYEWSKYAYDFGKMFMQTGLIGVFLFYGFLILDFANAFLLRKKEVGLIVSLAVIVTILASINWYCVLNSNCYIVFFFLSLIPCEGRNNLAQ